MSLRTRPPLRTMARAALLGVVCGATACSHRDDAAADSAADTAAPPTDETTCDPVVVSQTAEWLDVDLPTLRDHSHTPAGVALGDLDGDGWLDGILAYGGGSMALRNDGAGNLALEPGWTLDGGPFPDASAVALADLDGDGDLDGYLGRENGAVDVIFRNDGTGHFTSEPLDGSEGAPSTGAFADFDGDGDLDLFIGSNTTDTEGADVVAGLLDGDGCLLYLQDATGHFVDATANLPADVLHGWTFQGAPIDADGDGDLDIYMADDFGAWLTPNHLLINDGTAHFTVAEDCFCDLVMFGMGAAVGDANGDGIADLYVSDIGGPNLLIGVGDGTFYDATVALGADIPPDQSLTSWGTSFLDIDQDAWNDMAVTFGRLGQSSLIPEIEGENSWVDGDEQPDVLVVADGQGGFTRPDTGWADPSRTRAVAVGDLDRDGRPDLVTAGKYFLRTWHTDGGCDPGVRVTVDAGPLNHQGIGSRVQVTHGAHVQTQWMLPSTTGSSNAPELYFGLHGAGKADRIDVTWPDGTTSSQTDVPAGTSAALVE